MNDGVVDLCAKAAQQTENHDVEHEVSPVGESEMNASSFYGSKSTGCKAGEITCPVEESMAVYGNKMKCDVFVFCQPTPRCQQKQDEHRAPKVMNSEIKPILIFDHQGFNGVMKQRGGSGKNIDFGSLAIADLEIFFLID